MTVGPAARPAVQPSSVDLPWAPHDVESARARRRLVRLVWLAIAASSAVRIPAVWSSFFWQDDYLHIWKAWNWPAPQLILQVWNGHFEPVPFAFYWAISRLWPQQWWPAAMYLSALAVVLPMLWWWIVRSAIGLNGYSVASLVLFAFWPGLLIPQMWLATGLEMGAFGWALAVLGFSLQPGRRQYLALLCLPIGCLFQERALFAVPLVMAGWLILAEGRLIDRLRRIRQERGRLLLALVLEGVLLLILLGSLAGSDSVNGAPFDVQGFLAGLWVAGPQGMLQSLAGLQFFWPDYRTTGPVPAPMWVTALLLVALGALLIGGLRRDRRQVLVCLVIVTVALAVEVLLVSVFRAEWLGRELLRDPRYTLMSGSLVLLSIASFGSRRARPQEAPPVRRAASMAVAVAVVLGVASMMSVVRVVAGGEPRAWLDEARAQFVGADRPPMTVTASPRTMIGDLFLFQTPDGYWYSMGSTRTLMQVGPSQPRFTTSSDLPVGAGSMGGASAVELSPVLSRTPGAWGGGCSIVLQSGRWRTVPLGEAKPLFPAVAFDYLAAEPATVDVRVGSWQTRLELGPGFRTGWVFPPPGPMTPVQIRQVGDGRGICLGEMRIGEARTLD